MPLTTSVVLCTWNGARYLPAQWASVLAQSRLPDEIVVRDDASTDATPELLAELAADAEARGIAVRCMRGERNLGYVANFEAALRAASGDVLFLCDQDDVWHPVKLATQLAAFEQRHELLLLCSDARRIDASGVDLQRALFEVLRITRGELRRIHAGDGFGVLLRRSMATGATVALRRILLADALPFPAGWVHDEWLAIVAAALGGFDCVEQMLVDYRQHEGNQLGMPARDFAQQWRDLVKPQAADVDAGIARTLALRERVHAFGARVSETDKGRLDDRLQHLDAIRALHGQPWHRLGPVLRGLVKGAYRRHGSGWRSALRDVLRRD